MARVKVNPHVLKAWMDSVKDVAMDAAKEGAEIVAEAAKQNLERIAPASSGTLASEISMHVKQGKKDGYVIEAQASGNYTRYYAIHVELGTTKRPGTPYLRPAIKRRKKKIRDIFQRRLKEKGVTWT